MLSNNSKDKNINNSSSSPTSSRDSLDVNLSEYLVKLKRRWKPALAIFLLTLGVTGGLSLLQKKTYQGEGKLVFKQLSAADQVGIGENAGRLDTILPNQTPVSTQIQVLESEPVIQQVIDRQKLTDDENNPLKTDDFRKKLSTELIGGTDVVEVRYKHPDPKIAAEVVNTLMDVYIQEQIRGNQSEPEAAKDFINRELPTIESKVEQAEQNISAFRSENDIVDLTEEKKGLVTNLGALNQQISTTGSELQGLQAQTSALQSQLGLDLNQAVATDQLAASPEVQSILGQLTETESSLAQERQRFSEEHPSIISLTEKKNDLNSQLKGLIANTVGQGINVSQGLLQENNGIKENQLEKFITLKIDELSLQRQVTSLYQSQQNYLKRAKDIPRLEKQEQELIRNAEAAGNTLETLLDNLQKVQIAASQESGNAKVVEYSSVPEKGASGRTMLLGLGLVLGAFLANLSVVLLEMQDRSLKTLAEIKKKFSYQTIGIIPLEAPNYQGRIVTREEPDSFSSEVYRMIQANLKFLTSDKPPKVILVTSSVPEEGKSTVTANLAAAIAQLDRKVLLIDGDLRRSSQHRLWGVGNNKGLKDIITSNVSLASVIAKPMPNLSLLTSGMVNSNPLALLDSPGLSDLVGRSRRDYDLILIDAPPLPVTADVLTLSKLVDGILFVTRPGVVEQESAELAQETLATTGQKVLGMVINGVKAADFDRYSYHGRYGKSYYTKNNSATQNNDNWQKNNQVNQDLPNVSSKEKSANNSVGSANF
ncbi:polysaccharide biosynthesis tyrosine autokinase [Waterburya agarophytonicola K14]|uniref:Polysaccharide biosynthesis tyrosine autokinase n=1 Tax=Waterburya agarophytonicola KI4 TaxID=2874699 RepID=A0A964BSG7_9CYAN|nr:polysaccharide biosynthesis tyrosine autokinase [Waterburya agarophytonicola]MCC0177436.1 polysaccharide biosynthesis tyrosine autokinase [Waterburya agarophytonicola KI4]